MHPLHFHFPKSGWKVFGAQMFEYISILVHFGMSRGAKLIALVPTQYSLFFCQCAQNSKDLPISVRMHQMR